jgi:glutaconate CoA-transferase subunit B
LEILSLHPGTSLEVVIQQTGFPVERPAEMKTTAAPTPAEFAALNRLDPNQLRFRQVES